MSIDNHLLDNSDRQIIDALMAAGGGDIWDNDTIRDIKVRIKEYFRVDNGGHCCYCLQSFRGGFRLVIDIEHVLPKSAYRDLMFDLFNLNISCKRCNMLIKKDRTDFLADEHNIRINLRDPRQYLLTHPNLDIMDDNVQLLSFNLGRHQLVKYLTLNDKGAFNREYFRYEELEIEALNVAQGISEKTSEMLATLPIGLTDQLKLLLDQL